MGAAGLTCSSCEMGARGGAGIEIDIARVPQRESGMTPYEIMLSESQERMLFIVRRGREAEVDRVFAKWDLHAVRIGEVTGDGLLRVRDRGAGRWPRSPTGRWPTRRRSTTARTASRRTSPRGRRSTVGAGAARPAVPRSCCGSSARLRHREQALDLPPVRPHGADQHHRCRPGPGPGVVRVKGTRRALAFSVDGNGRYCCLDPYRGAMLAVAESARNVACAGATADRRPPTA